jgi:hypothetical protein
VFVVIITDNPKANKVVCTIHPLINPAVVAKPLLLPFTRDCVNTYILSGPGLHAKIRVATVKESKDSSMYYKMDLIRCF